MDFFETSEALNNEDILQSENELGVNFPKEFIAHYLKHNGGRSEYDKYVWRDGGTTRINSFFPIKYYSFGNIETTYKDLVILENYLPKGIVPFATDDGGNFFAFRPEIMILGIFSIVTMMTMILIILRKY